MQNLATLTLTEAQLNAVDQALSQLETQFTDLIALSPADRLRMAKLGDRTDRFCRTSLQMLAANPQLIPPNLDLNDAQRDLQARDQLLPRIQRLERLLQRSNDTAMALGSDSLAVANKGYALLKLVGRSEGLDTLRRDLSSRFAKGKREVVEGKKAA
jgi:hypothetical protein